ncbi:MAG: minor capsid protein [Thermoplasmatales archaeon]|nr:minor capsid protein [Thermoplasmatales archaeon]
MLNTTKAQIEKALKLHQQQVANELTKQSVKAHIAGDLKAYKVLKSPTIAFDLVQKEAIAYGKKYGTLLKKEGASIINGNKVAWLAESTARTRTNVFDTINEGLRTGKPVDTIGRELRETLIRDKNYEYKRIARTEVARIQSEGSMNRYKANDVKKVKWLCGGNPCPICQQHCNNIYNINDAPSIPVHPNCTCDKAPVITRAVRETLKRTRIDS